MRIAPLRPLLLLLLAAVLLCRCATQRPDWYSETPTTERGYAYEKFLSAFGHAHADNRALACQAAEQRALAMLLDGLIAQTESAPDVIAAAGGPSRFARTMEIYLHADRGRVNQTHMHYDEHLRHCYIKVRFLMPRNIASAVRRALDDQATEDSVALELKRALTPEAATQEGGPVEPTAARGYPNPAAAALALYPGWFVRTVNIERCATHAYVFAGAPSGQEARWLEAKQTTSGWRILDETLLPDSGPWPAPPELVACDPQ